jgi:DNA-directed RNA polymerase specialized sigma24 family protein
MDRDTALALLRRVGSECRDAAVRAESAQRSRRTTIEIAHEQANLTYVEIAQVLGVHRNTVLNWLHARDDVRDHG